MNNLLMMKSPFAVLAIIKDNIRLADVAAMVVGVPASEQEMPRSGIHYVAKVASSGE